jgi:hypothetical protein
VLSVITGVAGIIVTIALLIIPRWQYRPVARAT